MQITDNLDVDWLQRISDDDDRKVRLIASEHYKDIPGVFLSD